MNVRLQYDLEFLGGIYFEEQLQMNQYSVSLNLVTGTADPADTNTAMDRVKAFVFGELEHSVFMNGAQRERAELMHMMGINVTTLPEEPVDQIIGMMLYYKLNAIMEGRMTVRSLDISSTLGDAVWYHGSTANIDQNDLDPLFRQNKGKEFMSTKAAGEGNTGSQSGIGIYFGKDKECRDSF